jgi:hypothetical protein
LKNINFTQLVDLENVREALFVLLQGGGIDSYGLMTGKAINICDFNLEFTGWFERKICTNNLASQNGVIIFSTNPFQVFHVSSNMLELYQVEMAANLYAIDNRTINKKEKLCKLTTTE